MLSPSLRKAALLISALEEDAAEAVLQQMSADDAAKVRSALVELDEIQADEQQAVLAEFLQKQGAPSAAPDAPDDVALELDPVVEAAAGTPESHSSSAELPLEDETPLAFLEHVDPSAIAA